MKETTDHPASGLEKIVATARVNDPGGQIAHHFVLAGKIKTVYVNRSQHEALAAGRLAIVVMGRYHIVPAACAARIQSLDRDVPVILAREEPPDDGVPDNLIW